MTQNRRRGMLLTLAWSSALIVGCSRDNPPTIGSVLPATSATVSTSERQQGTKAPLKDLMLALPAGWTATYDAGSRWRVEKNAPPAPPVILIWSLSKEQTPTGLIHFSHRLQTSSALTEGKCFLDRRTEQGNFGDGYYVVGKFIQKSDRRVRDLGLAMIRKLGGHTLIFECLKIADPDQKQEILDICKSASF